MLQNLTSIEDAASLFWCPTKCRSNADRKKKKDNWILFFTMYLSISVWVPFIVSGFFYRLNNLICYIPHLCLPSGHRKFGDWRSKYQGTKRAFSIKLYIFVINLTQKVIYSCSKAHALQTVTCCVSMKSAHMFKKKGFVSYIAHSPLWSKIASKWWCLWMWGMATPNSLNGMCRRLLGVVGWGRPRRQPPGEPALAHQTTGGAQRSFGISNFIPRG